MKIKLYYRHYGVHNLKREVEIVGKLRDYVKLQPKKHKNIIGDDYKIDEEKLLNAIPKDFLPCSSKKILLIVNDSGQTDLKKFLNWAKYFDCYSLELTSPTPNLL